MQRPRFGFTLIELMIVVAILGILAVVAIPAFVRYMRIAKTAEVKRMMNKMEKGLFQYYSRAWPNTSGTPQPCQFPKTAPLTPDNGNGPYTCCSDGEPDGKCEPNETAWDTDSWRAQLFKISDKHYYTYGMDGLAFGFAAMPGPQAGIYAVGDLDCDGTYSSFMMVLIGDAGTDGIVNCRVRKLGGVHIISEAE